MEPVHFHDGGVVRETERIVRGIAVPISIDGRSFVSSPVFNPPQPEEAPRCDPLRVATLDALVEFIIANRDASHLSARGGFFVHVAGPAFVFLRTSIFGERKQREIVVVSEAIVPAIAFGKYTNVEEFVIGAQCNFIENGDRGRALALVGTLSTEEVRTDSDDGVTQTASARRGVVSKATVENKNPYRLAPFRTFAEVAQPESPFVLRLRGGGDGEQPEVALFEADGGKWRLDAIASIKAYLRRELGGVTPPIEVYG